MKEKKGPPPPPKSRAFLAYDKLRVVYDMVPVGILLCGPGGQILHSNKRAQRMLGFSPEELQQFTLQELSSPGHEEAVPRVLNDLGDPPTGTLLNHSVQCKGGGTLFSRTGFTGLKDSAGKPQYLVVTLEDISDVVESRMRLSRSVDTLRLANQEVRDLLESLGEGVVMVDMRGDLRVANRIARVFIRSNRTRQELLSAFQVWNQDDVPITCDKFPLCVSLETQTTLQNEILKIQALNQKPKWVITSSRPTYRKGVQTGAILVFRDITELVEQRNTLEKSNEDLERFAAIASHDLQEPPRQIAAYADRALTKFGRTGTDELPERVISYLETIKRSACRMQVLISDLLSYSRVGRHGDPFEVVSIARLLRLIREDYQTKIQAKNAKITIGNLPEIEGDPTQLRLLFQNLFSNALKFQDPDKTPLIEIYATVKNNLATFTVRDNGIGFNPEYRNKVFEVFRRLVGKSTYPGTGIGLALCRRIAEYHGGHIEASSTLGIGSQFVVTLPVHQPEGAGP